MKVNLAIPSTITVLTDEFAEILHKIGQNLDDSVLFNSLYFGEVAEWNAGLLNLKPTLTEKQNLQICLLFYKFVRLEMSVGKIRDMPLIELNKIRGVGFVRGTFVKNIFRVRQS